MKQKKTPQVAQRESDSKNRLKAEPYIQQPLDYIWPSIIAAIAFLLYANTLQHGYVLDDAIAITTNQLVQKGFKIIFFF